MILKQLKRMGYNSHDMSALDLVQIRYSTLKIAVAEQ